MVLLVKTITRKELKQYAGEYELRTILYKEQTLFYKRENAPEYKMMPIRDDLFILQGLDYFRIKFKKNKNGKVIELIGLYKNGSISPSKRTGN